MAGQGSNGACPYLALRAIHEVQRDKAGMSQRLRFIITTAVRVMVCNVRITDALPTHPDVGLENSVWRV